MLFFDAIIYLALVCSAVLAAPSYIDVHDKIYPPDPPATHHVLMGIKYYDEEAKKEKVDEVIIDLYGTVTPLTVQNFATIGRGLRVLTDAANEEGSTMVTYKKTLFTKLIKDDIIEGGEVLPGITPFSMYGFKFADENFFLKHDRPGRVSLVNDGEPDTNDSRFSISLNANGSPERDGLNVVFGQVIFGYDNLEKIQLSQVSSKSHRPEHDITISYIVVDELKISDLAKLHQEYMDKLTKFENGDQSVGIKLGPTRTQLKEGRKKQDLEKEERRKLHDMKLAQNNNPVMKISIGFVLLLILYLITTKRKLLFSRSSANVTNLDDPVSIRKD
ncbi:similar to Saccharomyces cerevisiae YCR069W CPR4 Peptidyl-prolyl cis-trans isomerase (cyclophilin) [Maudiozyma saulgeensis]|uniref:Similar to Saccharomyces cerevisiae YCR069W CPR4 Peptidyl-prolyl cis-trans isomerase (Cyclophilin) n=1 Tax=Maudiozyma saulgeensis TaxID=1789683 RepID=A0A1X7R7J8_9SACH|nr:similar to Saccharomyces cerevisiae YCR069W CPR4 Peptidyl-prolyl cis-trans isomerase (cyclophilin) [Kazachstania saulgeensis]